MKRAWMLTLALAAGCSSAPDADPDLEKPKSEAPAPPPPSPKEAEIRSVRTKLARDKAELSQATADLDRIAAERAQLDGQEASTAKTSRLAELATLESSTKQKKQALGLDIADGEARLRDLSSSATSADPLAAELENDAAAERERAEIRKAKDEADRSEQGRRIAAADAARKAESEAKSKEKVDGGRVAAAGDGAIFEERWADVILKVRESLQEFKRW